MRPGYFFSQPTIGPLMAKFWSEDFGFINVYFDFTSSKTTPGEPTEFTRSPLPPPPPKPFPLLSAR